MELQSTNDMQAMESGNAQQRENNSSQIESQHVVSEQRIHKPVLLLFWQLIPFFRRVFLYFAIIVLDDNNFIDLPLILRAILKCAPLMTLTVFVFRQFNSVRLLFRNKYGLFIFIGHLMAITGSMLVVFDDNIDYLFLVGKGCHLVAVGLYTFAFGFSPFASRLFIRSLIAGCVGYYYLYLGAESINANFDLASKIVVALYVAALLTMQWRAWARITFLDLKQGRWYEFFGGLGSSVLVIAESIALIDRFLKPAGASYFLLDANYSVLALLYVGNFGIALSVLDGPNVVWPQEKEAQKKNIHVVTWEVCRFEDCRLLSIIAVIAFVCGGWACEFCLGILMISILQIIPYIRERIVCEFC